MEKPNGLDTLYNRKKLVAKVFRKRVRLQASRKTKRDFLRKRRNSGLGEFRFFTKKIGTSDFPLVPTWRRRRDSFSAEKPAHSSFVPPAQNSLLFASNPY